MLVDRRKLSWIFVIGLFSIATAANAQENAWWKNNPNYNEDEWYDPTDWFDGNNYEYDPSGSNEYSTNYRADNQNAGNAYDNYGHDGWFYDRYDNDYRSDFDYDHDGIYDYSYRYHDYDHDGQYDAMTWYNDWDNDGLYDDWDYVTFDNDDARSVRNSERNEERQSRQAKVTGQIERTKNVQVGDQNHLVAVLKLSQDKRCVADLGSKSLNSDLGLHQGDRITVRGAASKVGNRRILMAKSITTPDGERQLINRQGNTLTGTIQDVRYAQVQNVQHALITIKADGRSARVDLGPAENLQSGLELRKGKQVSVSGPVVKVDGQRVIMATRAKIDGKAANIDRNIQSYSTNQRSQNNS